MEICEETYANWEKSKIAPVAAQFRPVLQFLGYDPSPTPTTLAERLQAKRRALGITFEQVAKHLGWDPGPLTRYLNGTWRIPSARTATLNALLKKSTREFVIPSPLPRRR